MGFGLGGGAGVFFPTGGAEPSVSGSGKPDRFNREPEQTVEFKIQTKTRSSNGSHWYTDRSTGSWSFKHVYVRSLIFRRTTCVRVQVYIYM
jgi:hypothetical protein